MDKLTEKGTKLSLALKRLSEALEDYKKLALDSIRDGVIQRFEFCTELAWKTTREYLIDQGYNEGVDSPKAVMRKAYSAGLIENEQGWIELLNVRNLTSHIYDEETAQRVFAMIQDDFLPPLPPAGRCAGAGVSTHERRSPTGFTGRQHGNRLLRDVGQRSGDGLLLGQ